MTDRPIYVSPTEPHSLRESFIQSPITEKYGVDILWSCPKGLVGVQRKTPEDLVSSLRDGRISKQTTLSEGLFVRAVFIEGYPSFTVSGTMVTFANFTKNQWTGATFGLRNSGWWVVQCRDRTDLIEHIERLHSYTQKTRHSTAASRKAPKKDSWKRISNRSWGVHILTGIPGIGQGTAENILDYFGRVPLSWDVTRDELEAVKGVGKKTIQEMTRFIRPWEEDV